MSILIKGMDMPENCTDCNLTADGWCYAIEAWDHKYDDLRSESRPDWCPLVEVPTPHGNLKDVDKVYTELQSFAEETRFCWTCDYDIVKDYFDIAPTIIEAEE